MYYPTHTFNMDVFPMKIHPPNSTLFFFKNESKADMCCYNTSTCYTKHVKMYIIPENTEKQKKRRNPPVGPDSNSAAPHSSRSPSTKIEQIIQPVWKLISV